MSARPAAQLRLVDAQPWWSGNAVYRGLSVLAVHQANAAGL